MYKFMYYSTARDFIILYDNLILKCTIIQILKILLRQKIKIILVYTFIYIWQFAWALLSNLNVFLILLDYIMQLQEMIRACCM